MSFLRAKELAPDLKPPAEQTVEECDATKVPCRSTVRSKKNLNLVQANAVDWDMLNPVIKFSGIDEDYN